MSDFEKEINEAIDEVTSSFDITEGGDPHDEEKEKRQRLLRFLAERKSRRCSWFR